jgi:hypothetical protein
VDETFVHHPKGAIIVSKTILVNVMFWGAGKKSSPLSIGTVPCHARQGFR